MEIETHSIWSVHAGKFQVWNTIRAEHHKIPNVSDLTTPSFYSDEEYPLPRPRLYVGNDTTIEKFNQPITERTLWFWVNPSKNTIKPRKKEAAHASRL